MAEAKKTPKKTPKERIVAAARELAREMPASDIGLSEIARRADVSWPTVKRYIGGRAALLELLGVDPRDEDARGTRQRLLDAAGVVFTRDGFDGATIDEIAGEAGLSKGAVYWHFRNKRQLLLALLDGLVSFPAEPAVDVARDLPTALRTHLERELSGERWPRVIADAATLRDDAVEKKLRQLIDGMKTRAAGLLSRLVSEGRCAEDVDSKAAGGAIATMITGLSVHRAFERTGSDARQILTQSALVLARGVEGSRSRGRRSR